MAPNHRTLWSNYHILGDAMFVNVRTFGFGIDIEANVHRTEYIIPAEEGLPESSAARTE